MLHLQMKRTIMKTKFAALMFAAATAAFPFASQAGVDISVSIAPPALPIYAQPPIPGDGYIWTPGYWSWNAADNDYYWVPGTWVAAPYSGALWTPGYWGWVGGSYRWNGGYWGDHIGYYGGVNYGYGYVGVGYQGGHWDHGVFNYNRSVNNVTNIRNIHVYNSRVTVNNTTRVSYSGGQGGVRMEPTKGEQVIREMPHAGPTEPQANHETLSRTNPAQRASVNHGVPPIAATPEPGKFNAPNVVAARAESQAKPQAKPQAHQSAPHGGGSHGSEHHR